MHVRSAGGGNAHSGHRSAAFIGASVCSSEGPDRAEGGYGSECVLGSRLRDEAVREVMRYGSRVKLNRIFAGYFLTQRRVGSLMQRTG